MLEVNNFLDINKFEKLECVGEGSFSKVFKIKEKGKEIIYAAKIMRTRLEDFEEDFMINLRREIRFMSQLIHPSITKFIGYSPINFKQSPKPVIVTEYLSNGSLSDIIKAERRDIKPESWNITKKLINIYGIASAMSYLHSKNIIHRDLKPANILQDDSYYPKLADFGLSKKKHTHEQSLQMSIQSVKCLKGTPAFIAPESFEDYEYEKAGDIYAFSLIVYELMTLQKPYSELNCFNLALKVANGYRPSFKNQIEKCYRDLIEACWATNPNDRPTFEEITSLLANNNDFIIDGVDENEFRNYVDLLNQEEESTNKNLNQEKSNKNSDDLIQAKPSNSSEKSIC